MVGETPNLVARLQGFAGLNQLVIPEDTRRLPGAAFGMTPMGEQGLKGIAAPVQAFVVSGETAQESRFAARRSGAPTPIVEREFSHRLVAQISHLPEAELTAALDGSNEAELTYRRGLPPEATYLFKHALVRDAAYESLLRE